MAFAGECSDWLRHGILSSLHRLLPRKIGHSPVGEAVRLRAILHWHIWQLKLLAKRWELHQHLLLAVVVMMAIVVVVLVAVAIRHLLASICFSRWGLDQQTSRERSARPEANSLQASTLLSDLPQQCLDVALVSPVLWWEKAPALIAGHHSASLVIVRCVLQTGQGGLVSVERHDHAGALRQLFVLLHKLLVKHGPHKSKFGPIWRLLSPLNL